MHKKMMGLVFCIVAFAVNASAATTPTITWSTPGAITAGTALSATQLNATATVNGTALAGSFVYSPAAGTVLAAGLHTLSTTFTPTDTVDYTTATANVQLAVSTSLPIVSPVYGSPACTSDSFH